MYNTALLQSSQSVLEKALWKIPWDKDNLFGLRSIKNDFHVNLIRAVFSDLTTAKKQQLLYRQLERVYQDSQKCPPGNDSAECVSITLLLPTLRVSNNRALSCTIIVSKKLVNLLAT